MALVLPAGSTATVCTLTAGSPGATTAISGSKGSPREVAESLVLMMAPFTPHIAEELWSLLRPGAPDLVAAQHRVVARRTGLDVVALEYEPSDEAYEPRDARPI